MKRIFQRGRYANVVSTLALLVALGGTSYAAIELPKNSVGSSQIQKGAVKGSDIKADAVTSPKVKDGSLLAQDFKAGQIPAGPAGATGATGATGPRGPSDGYVAREIDGVFTNLGLNTRTTVGSLNVPAGKYVVWAKGLYNSNDAAVSTGFCFLKGSSEEDNFSDGVRFGPQGGDDREIVTLSIAPQFATPGQITLSCESNVEANVGKVVISAISVDNLTTTVTGQ